MFLTTAVMASADLAAVADDLTIADFEAEGYGDWVATGDAFGDGPARGTLPNQQSVTGFGGDGLVNTYLNGDGTTGTLTSPVFVIERAYLSFLIGGGMHADTCLQLLVDDEVVASLSGMNDERLVPGCFDVSALRGKAARLRVVDNNRGSWGHINIDEIKQTDTKPAAPLFSMRQRSFEVANKYLVIPIKNGARKCKLTLAVDGKPVRVYETELATTPDKVDWWAFLTIEAYEGSKASLSVNPATEEAFALVEQADAVPGADEWYSESLRPQLRFSQKVGWNNDPNGMVYHQGKWHLFFQYNPVGWDWGNMTWGHAVSEDLVHWEHMPSVLFPETSAVGACFSGGAVTDPLDTAGFKTGDEAPIVAFFTDTGAGEAIAYSNDGGRTFTPYKGNPVVRHSGRDPKVIWYAYDEADTPLDERAKQLGGHWAMVVYDEQDGQNTAFYTSTNLREWQFQSRLYGFFECPELFELPVDGAAGDTRWVTYAADGKYVLGSFDGRTFKPDGDGKHTLFYGNYYAAQTFDNAPGGRRIQIGWTRGTNFHGMPFNQTFSFPHRLTLRTTGDGVRMFAEPVEEIAKLREDTKALADRTVTPDQPAGIDVSSELLHVRAVIEPGDAARFGVDIGGERIVYDVAAAKLDQAALQPNGGKVTIEAIVDRSVLEIIGNDGRVHITKMRGARGAAARVDVFAEGGEARLVELRVHKLRSIWSK